MVRSDWDCRVRIRRGYAVGMWEKSYPDVQLAEKAVSMLGSSLKAVSRKEPIGGERETDICRFGDVEGCKRQLRAESVYYLRESSRFPERRGSAYLVLSRLQRNIVAKLEHAGKGIVEHSNTFFA